MSDLFRTACDALDIALQGAEEMIREQKLGVAGEVELSETDDGCRTLLVYGPEGSEGKRTLHIAKTKPGQFGDIYDHKRGFKAASIDTRLAAAEAIPTLLDYLREARKDRTRSVQGVADALEAFVETIEPPETR